MGEGKGGKGRREEEGIEEEGWRGSWRRKGEGGGMREEELGRERRGKGVGGRRGKGPGGGGSREEERRWERRGKGEAAFPFLLLKISPSQLSPFHLPHSFLHIFNTVHSSVFPLFLYASIFSSSIFLFSLFLPPSPLSIPLHSPPPPPPNPPPPTSF